MRTASAADLPTLGDIERAADRVFEAVGIVFPPGGTVVDTVTDPADVLVAGDPPVAFAYVGPLDGHLHLHQIAVDPAYARQGLGTALMQAVIARAGARGVTLTTFADVPWNGPWYAKLGFTVLAEPGPELAELVHEERLGGLNALGERWVMYRPSRIRT
ncbi:GNAT family N-acetyltransferase [Kibdelosporangium philippinense]|uniref:GNAT family N-acetyltransferase n=1 Tax=Kibdelosporangium philippinense TaxID=211113 RepID=A0ABS8ZUS6_9PSEU|nr:GNAT family N-acetyltransferase [Kibdelosporangium philippinense]MCE7009582.1 GNAT family N-acetyltransferase [Kibdelosporangium philippinense]